MRRHYKSEREKAKGKNNDLSHVPSKEKKKENQEPLAVARLLFLTSNLQLPPPTIYIYRGRAAF